MILRSWLRMVYNELFLQSRLRTRRHRCLPRVEALDVRLLLTVPVVSSINLVTTSPTAAGQVTWEVDFDQPVFGVDPTDFTLLRGSTVGSTLMQVVPQSKSVYLVTASGLTGSGTLGLNLVDDDSILNFSFVRLGGIGLNNGNFTGQVATLDHVAPYLVSINRAVPAGNTANSIASFTATFSEDVKNVLSQNFSAVTTGNVTANPTYQIAKVSASVYTVTVAGITGAGTLGLNCNGSGTITDLVGNPLVAQNAAASFANQTTFATGSDPVSETLGDLNGDGKPDLVVANYTSNTVSVLLGNGNGTFQTQVTFATGSSRSVTLGDLNGDGKPDLAVANLHDNTVSVLLGNGNGTFQTQATFATANQPFSVTLGDLNGDGKLDLAVSCSFNINVIGVLLGNGNGTFQTQVTFTAGNQPFSVTLGDLNGDGKPDLAFANRSANTAGVLLGNGNGTFQTQVTFATGTMPNSVSLGDLNGDGKPDLAVANLHDNTVSVLLGNGNGTFQTQTTFATSTNPYSVTMGDLNGDGKNDLAVATGGSNTVSVLLGNGNGTFQNQTTFTTGTEPTSVTLGDLNGDGKLDLAVTNWSDSSVSVLLGAGNGSFTGQVYNVIDAPTIVAPTVASLTNTTAVLGGNITADGGYAILERGVVYALASVNPNPQIGGVGVTQVVASGASVGQFTVNATNLTQGLVYVFAPYATISLGTRYTSPPQTFVPGPVVVSRMTDAAGAKVIQTGDTLSAPVSSLAVNFSENMNVVPAGANSVINPLNWRLLRYGIDVSNQISGITFAFDPVSLKYIAKVSFSLPLVQGGYQLVVRQTIQDLAGRTLDGDADGVAGGDFRINFYVASVIGGVTDIGPWLYQIEDKPLSAVASATTPVSSSLLVFDADSNNWTGATIQITSNYHSDQDVLAFVNTSKIVSLWDPTTGTLSLLGTDTVSNYRTALHNVTYHNSSNTPNTSVTRTIEFITSDGLLASNVISRDLNVTTASVPAVLSGVFGTGTFYEDYPATPLVAYLVISDPDTVNLASASITFTGWQGEDRIEFNNIFALQHTFVQDLVTHTAAFTITGTDTVDHYQTLLRSVIYWDVTGNPITTARVASVSVSDGSSTSNVVTRSMIVSASNSLPTLWALESTPLAYKANDPAFPPQSLSSTLMVGDPDSNNLTKAIVQITAGYQNNAFNNDVLSFVNQNGITGVFDASTGALTLTGTSSVSNYRTALRSVMFSSSGPSVNTANRTLTIAVADDFSPAAVSLSITRTVTVSTINTPPAITGIPAAGLSYVRGAVAVAIASNALILDADSINLMGATVQITGNDQAALDVLSATTGLGITNSFTASTGTLTLSGMSSLANYQTILRSVAFNTTIAANTLSRTLTFTLNDGLASSSSVTRIVALS